MRAPPDAPPASLQARRSRSAALLLCCGLPCCSVHRGPLGARRHMWLPILCTQCSGHRGPRMPHIKLVLCRVFSSGSGRAPFAGARAPGRLSEGGGAAPRRRDRVHPGDQRRPGQLQRLCRLVLGRPQGRSAGLPPLAGQAPSRGLGWAGRDARLFGAAHSAWPGACAPAALQDCFRRHCGS